MASGEPAAYDGEDYEALRQRNIARNMAKLAELQLVGLSSLAPTPAPRVRNRNPKRKEPAKGERFSGRERKRSEASLASERYAEEELAELARRREEKKQAFFQRRAKEDAPKRHGVTPEAERLKKSKTQQAQGGAAGGGGGGGGGGGWAAPAPRVRPSCEDCATKDPAPSFGLERDKKRRWCHSCAKGHAGAVLLKAEPCEDCQLTDPSFGLPDEKERRWCHGCAMKRPGSVCLTASHGRVDGWSPIERDTGGAAAMAAGFFPEPGAPPVHLPGGWSVHYGDAKTLGHAIANNHKKNRRCPPCEDCLIKDPSFGLRSDLSRRRWCKNCEIRHEGATWLKHRTMCVDCSKYTRNSRSS